MQKEQIQPKKRRLAIEGQTKMGGQIQLTVFTPTYNRGDDQHLGKCYRDLCAQTCKEFIWLIVDDGSDDHTDEYVKPWMTEASMEKNGFLIQYLYKENGGTHTGYNAAFDACGTELICCLETDDGFEPTAVEHILSCAKGGDQSSIGLISNAYDMDTRQVIGKGLPRNCRQTSYTDCYYKYGFTGDKFFVYKMSAIGTFRFPEYAGEKLCATSAMLMLVPGKYKVMHEAVYRKTYLADGYTRQGRMKNYRCSPNGFAYAHLVRMHAVERADVVLKSAAVYVACSLLGTGKVSFKGVRKKWAVAIALPVGVGMYLSMRRYYRKVK